MKRTRRKFNASFKSRCTKNEYFDEVFKILNDEISTVTEVGVTSENQFRKMDGLLDNLNEG